MAFQKINYIDEVTVIPAENLNAIQDELIRLISALDGGSLKGDTGVGIASIIQTTTSTADDGNNVITVTLTNDEQYTFTVQNGSKGSEGETGPAGRGIVSIRRTSGNGAAGTTDVYTITYTDNTTSTFSVYNGADGTGGSGGTGANGATFTPHVDSSGNLSWSNDKGLANPATVNIKGPKGDKGDTGNKGDKGDKGDTGEAGYSPRRGTDYWTASDIAEIKSYVDDAILGGEW